MYIGRVGHGPALVLVHGWAMHSGLFAPLTEALAPHFSVYLVDLPGHGRSREDAVLDFDHVIDTVLARVPGQAIWGGWSLGGLFALTAAQRHPERVAGVVGIATSPCFVNTPGWDDGVPAEVFARFAQGLIGDFDGTVERFLALEAIGSARASAQLRLLHEDVMAWGAPALPALQRGLALLEETDLRGAVSGLAMPSLWFAGRRDRLVPASALRWCAASASRADYVELASGHMPFLGFSSEMAKVVRTTFLSI